MSHYLFNHFFIGAIKFDQLSLNPHKHGLFSLTNVFYIIISHFLNKRWNVWRKILTEWTISNTGSVHIQQFGIDVRYLLPDRQWRCQRS